MKLFKKIKELLNKIFEEPAKFTVYSYLIDDINEFYHCFYAYYDGCYEPNGPHLRTVTEADMDRYPYKTLTEVSTDIRLFRRWSGNWLEMNIDEVCFVQRLHEDVDEYIDKYIAYKRKCRSIAICKFLARAIGAFCVLVLAACIMMVVSAKF